MVEKRVPRFSDFFPSGVPFRRSVRYYDGMTTTRTATIAIGTTIYNGRRKATTIAKPRIDANGIVTIRIRYAGGDAGTASYRSIDSAIACIA